MKRKVLINNTIKLFSKFFLSVSFLLHTSSLLHSYLIQSEFLNKIFFILFVLTFLTLLFYTFQIFKNHSIIYNTALQSFDRENNLKGMLLSANEFLNKTNNSQINNTCSSELLQSFINNISNNFSFLTSRTKLKQFSNLKYLLFNSILLSILILHISIKGNEVFSGILPGSTIKITADNYTIYPHKNKFLRGSSIILNIEFRDKKNIKIQNWKDRKVVFHYKDGTLTKQYEIKQDGFAIKNLSQNFSFYFSINYNSPARENQTTRVKNIFVYEPGNIIEVKANISAPIYLKSQLKPFETQGEIAAVEGSYVNLSVFANRILSHAYIQFFSSNLNSQILIKSKKIEMSTNGKMLNANFTVSQSSYYKIFAWDKNNKALLPSVLYSIHALKDRRPLFRIGGSSSTASIPDLSTISIDLNGNDDYALIYLALIAVVKNKVLYFKNLLQENSNLKKTKFIYSTEFNKKLKFDLRDIEFNRGETLSLYFIGRDNKTISEDAKLWKSLKQQSNFPENFPTYILANSKVQGLGQWGISRALKLKYLSLQQKRKLEQVENHSLLARFKKVLKNQKWIDKNLKYLKNQIKSKRLYSAKDKETLKDLQILSEKNKEELKLIKKAIKQKTSSKGFSQNRKKQKAISEVNDVLENELRKKELRLQELNNELGLNYKQAGEKLELLDDSTYIKKLENSIKSLENLILEKKINDIAKSLKKLENKQTKNIDHTLNKSEKKAQIQKAQNDITKGIHNAKKLSSKLLQDKSLKKGKLKKILQKLLNSSDWNKASSNSKLSENLLSQNSDASSYKQRKVRQNISALRKKVIAIQKQFAAKDIYKAIKELKKASYRLIEISKVLSSEFYKLPDHISTTKKAETDKKSYKRMARLLTHLRESLHYSIKDLMENTKDTGLVSPKIESDFKKITPFFAKLKNSLENFNSYGASKNMQLLENSINFNTSLLLKYSSILKDLSKQQGKASAGMGKKQNMDQQMQMLGSMSKILGRKNGQKLSKSEKSYIQELLKEQQKLYNEASKNTDPSSKTGDKKIAALQEKLKQIRNALNQGSKLKWKEKIKALKSEYMKYKNAKKNSGEKKQRESEQAITEYELPSIKKLTSSQIKQKKQRYWNSKNNKKNYSPEQILFYRNYLRSMLK